MIVLAIHSLFIMKLATE